ncbi:hypothetical protein J3R82DRAFT_3616 [Butyriboletus roseoflavus]|nr:hypothetical protein J3R82DRAFT_3616 [Butyriboletus roseoflavus]
MASVDYELGFGCCRPSEEEVTMTRMLDKGFQAERRDRQGIARSPVPRHITNAHLPCKDDNEFRLHRITN